MSSFDFNVDEQPQTENKYKLHPAGTFKAAIQGMDERESKTKGNRFLMVKLVTPEGQLNDIINYENSNTDVQKRALSTLADLLFSCGDKKKFKGAEEIISYCEGKEVYIRVYHSKPKEGFQVDAKVGSYANLKKVLRDGSTMAATPTKSAAEEDVAF